MGRVGPDEGAQAIKITPAQRDKKSKIILFSVVGFCCLPGLIGIVQLRLKDPSYQTWTPVAASTYETILTVYSVLSNVIGLASSFFISKYLLQVYKTLTTQMFIDKKPLQVDYLSAIHASLNSQDPSFTFYTFSRKKFRHIILLFIMALGYIAQFYGMILPFSILNQTALSDLKNDIRNIPLPTFYAWSLVDPSIVPQNRQKTGGNTGGFVELLYFSALQWRSSVLNGLVPILNGSVPIPGGFPDWNVNSTSIYSFQAIPFLKLDIVDWSYKILPLTASGATDTFGGTYSLPTGTDTSSFSLDTTLMNCIKTKFNPLSNCSSVGESVDFTLVQKLPLFTGTYESQVFTTDVFHLPGFSIANYPGLNTVNLQTAYVLTGKIKFSKTSLSVNRLRTTNELIYSQSFSGERNFVTYTTAEDDVYNYLKLAMLRLIEKQFTTTGYTWTQLKEYSVMNELPRDTGSNLKQEDFIKEMVRRLGIVGYHWNLMMTQPLSSSTKTSTLTLTTGTLTKFITVSVPLIISFVLLGIWVILIVLILLTWLGSRLKRNRLSKDQFIGEKSLLRAIDDICEHPHGLLLLKQRLEQKSMIYKSREIILSEDQGNLILCEHQRE